MAMLGGYTSANPSVMSRFKEIRGHLEGSEENVSEKLAVFVKRGGHHVCKYDGEAQARPCIAEDSKGNSLMLLGFINPHTFQKPSDTGEALLSLVASKGPASLEGLEGQFVAMYSESESSTVHIVNDRFASRPFYVLRNNEGTFYASSLGMLFTLAGMSPEPDPLGWLQISRFGHTLRKTTNCIGAQRLLPGTHLTIAPQGCHEHRYWKLQHTPVADLDPDQFADEVFDAFSSSARWRAERLPRGILALSGGLDSRLVAGCVPKERIKAFTFVNSVETNDTPEVSAASQVARRLGLAHEVKRITVGNYSRTAESVVRWSDGLLALHHPAKTMQYIERLDDRYQYLMGGGPGDSLAGGFVPNEEYLDSNRTTELVERFCMERGLGWQYLSKIFLPDVIHDMGAALDQSMRESFADIEGPTAAHRVTAWAMTVRQPAFTFTTPFHNHPKFEEGTAHLGYRYSDLMLKLPADWILFKNFYKYLIYRSFPDLRGIIYANTGKALTGQMERFVPRSVTPRTWKTRLKSGLKRIPLVQRARDLLPMELTTRRHYSFDFSIMSADTALLSGIEDMLDNPSVVSLVDVAKCRKFVRKFKHGKIQTTSDGDAAVIGSLAAFCLRMKDMQEKRAL